jgi:putative two-component system response regulator
MEAEQAKILIVDDEGYVCDLLSRWLTTEGYVCKTVENGDGALALLATERFDLVICDIMMPGMSGVDLLTIMIPLYPDVAVLMVTAVDDRKTAVMTLELGAFGYVIKPFDRNEILINVSNVLERRRLSILSRKYERELEIRARSGAEESLFREEEILLRLAAATGFRDHETRAHIKRIGLYSAEMARALGWPKDRIHEIKLAAPLHDVGKIGIPDRILLKPSSLSPEEFEITKRHTEIGARILEGSKISVLETAKDIALNHHERWDGSGYPRGLAQEAIPEAAGIVAVVDVYDSLVHKRLYRPAFSDEQALTMMIAGDGEYFGSKIFDCFLSLLPAFRRIREENPELENEERLCLADTP